MSCIDAAALHEDAAETQASYMGLITRNDRMGSVGGFAPDEDRVEGAAASTGSSLVATVGRITVLLQGRAVILQPRGAQAAHAMAIDGALPGKEFLDG